MPAFGFRALTRFYDVVVRAALKEQRVKSRLVAQVNPQPGHRVLDLGRGTGTLTIMLKQACPAATVIGLDAFSNASDNVHGRLVPLMEEAGLIAVAETHLEMTLFGALSLYRAVRPTDG